MANILKIVNNLLISKKPTYVVFFVTSICNARCKMCFNWRNIDNAYKKKELKLGEIKKIFKNFGKLQQLTVSGGEPTLRKDLPEILEFISHNNDVQVITLPTNGILPDKVYETAKRSLELIKPSTHLRITLSVEGVDKKHDEIVQVKGAFKNIQKTYQKLLPLMKKCNNLKVNVGICYSSFNKNHIKETFKYCKKYFKKSHILMSLVRGDTRDKKAKNITVEEYRDVADYYNKLFKSENRPLKIAVRSLSKMVKNQVATIMETGKMPVTCHVYTKLIVIQSNGDVFPCEYLTKKLGNLKKSDYDINRILNMRKNKKINQSIKNRECVCTWECALSNNIACDPRQYPTLAKQIIKDNLLKD